VQERKSFFGLCSQWRINEGQLGARAPGRINTLYSAFKNAFLSRNLTQNMPKNAYFGKELLNCRSVGLRPRTFNVTTL